MVTDIFNEVLFVNTIQKDERTDAQISIDLKNLKKEYPAITPLYELDYKRVLKPIHKYYDQLISNYTIHLFNNLIEDFSPGKLEEEYKYLYLKNHNIIKQYLIYVFDYMNDNQLNKITYLTSTVNNNSDENFVLFLIKYNTLMLYLELQERFKEYTDTEILSIEELYEVFFNEEPPVENPIIPYSGTVIQFKKKLETNKKVFTPIKGDLSNRTDNPKILSFYKIIKRTNDFLNLEKKLYENAIINESYNFIPTKGNKQLLAAFIHQLIANEYLHKHTYPGRKPIEDHKITKFFTHRYGQNSNMDKEFRNFKTKEHHKLKSLINSRFWLDSIV